MGRRTALSGAFQVAGAGEGSRNAVGERRMWASVIRQALNDYANAYGRYRTFDFAASSPAGRWLFDDNRRIGSFCWICEMINLDCDAVRAVLMTSDCYVKIRYLMRPNGMRPDSLRHNV